VVGVQEDRGRTVPRGAAGEDGGLPEFLGASDRGTRDPDGIEDAQDTEGIRTRAERSAMVEGIPRRTLSAIAASWSVPETLSAGVGLMQVILRASGWRNRP
jgi:hypothetical protein